MQRCNNISDSDRASIENDSKSLGQKINSVEAVQSIQNIINNTWNTLHDNSLPQYGNIKLELISDKFEDLIKSLILKLFPSETSELKDSLSI